MIGIIAFIGIFIATYFTYKTASGTGRNGPLWALATFGVGITLQVIIPIIIGLVMGIMYISSGTPVERLQDEIAGPSIVIGMVFIVLSFVGIWLVMRHVSKIPDEKPTSNVPPPPTFEN